MKLTAPQMRVLTLIITDPIAAQVEIDNKLSTRNVVANLRKVGALVDKPYGDVKNMHVTVEGYNSTGIMLNINDLSDTQYRVLELVIGTDIRDATPTEPVDLMNDSVVIEKQNINPDAYPLDGSESTSVEDQIDAAWVAPLTYAEKTDQVRGALDRAYLASVVRDEDGKNPRLVSDYAVPTAGDASHGEGHGYVETGPEDFDKRVAGQDRQMALYRDRLNTATGEQRMNARRVDTVKFDPAETVIEAVQPIPAQRSAGITPRQVGKTAEALTFAGRAVTLGLPLKIKNLMVGTGEVGSPTWSKNAHKATEDVKTGRIACECGIRTKSRKLLSMLHKTTRIIPTVTEV